MQKQDNSICFYSDSAEWGGHEILSARIANVLSGYFPNLHFVFSNPNFESSLKNSISKIRLPFASKNPLPILRDRAFKKKRFVQKLLEDLSPRLLIVCQGNIERCIPAILAAHALHIEVASYLPMAFTQSEVHARFGAFRDFLARTIYAKVSRWIVISGYQAKLLRRFVSDRTPVHILPNPLSWNFVSEPRQPSRFPKIAVIGRLYFAQKGQDFVPALAQKLTQEKFPCSFEIFGDGPDKKRLEDLIEKKSVKETVHVHDWISKEELLQKLKSEIDIVFICSHFEGVPMILIEALQCGIPVLIAREGYTEEFHFPEWMSFENGNLDDAAKKLMEFASRYNEQDFLELRDRVFKDRAEAEFNHLVKEIFDQISGAES